MGAPVRESDDGKSSKDEPSKNEPSKNEASKEVPREAGAAPSSRTTEAPEPPWKRKTQRGVFEGDVAVVELRSRLALTPDRIPEPSTPVSTVPKLAAVLRLMGIVSVAAAMAGVTGYLWGFRLSIKPPQLALASDQANVVPSVSTPAANRKASNLDSGPPAARTAATGLAPVAAVEAMPRPVPSAAGSQTALPSSASGPPTRVEDASEIAAKMKMGAELMAHGDIAAARMMFQRAAEAGEAAAAFAVAETYDPVVLRTLRVRGGITPDLALARSWYEKARDLGSSAAPERIVRLTQ
jgi:hypothetical protein